MIFVVIAALGLLGGTTWLVQNQAVAGHRALNRRWSAIGLMLSLGTAVALLAALAVTWP